jgi:hypothetical protein
MYDFRERGTVREKYAHPIACAYAARGQAARDIIGARVELRIRKS